MSTLKVNSITPVTAGSEDYFLGRSWVNFKGTSTVTIRQSGNVSSITDNSTGNYTINYSSAFSDSSYSLSGVCNQLGNTSDASVVVIRGTNASISNFSASSTNIATTWPTQGLLDSEIVCVGVTR